MKKLKVKQPDKKVLVVIVVFLVLLVLVPSIYFLAVRNSNNPEVEVASLQESVGKLIELPKEEPTVATVSDKTKLVGQPFFSKAENGDKVLIYEKSKKAILYRPGQKILFFEMGGRIIEVAPINLAQNPTGTSAASPTAAKVRLALYNGTQTSGLTRTVEAKLKTSNPNIEVVSRGNASNDYEKTIVVDLGGGGANVQSLAKALSGEVGKLPEGETKPANADILIILGKDASN